MLKEFFKNNESVESVRWRQYTPGFNDGEPCTFGVTDPHLKFKSGVTADFLRENLEYYYTQETLYQTVEEPCQWSGRMRSTQKEVGKRPFSDEEQLAMIEEGGDEEDGYFESYSFVKESEVRESLVDLSSVISDSEDILELIFGDGVSVEVSREGIEVDDYDCGY